MKASDKAIGIGGIGTGLLYLTEGNEQLGRSESRLAHLSDARDFCKLHIVFHYLSVLYGRPGFAVPIGHVGNDIHGLGLVEDMKTAGMDTSHVAVTPTAPTMFSVCLQYPDKEVCNLTSNNSACLLTTPQYVEQCAQKLGVDAATIVVALPEVSIESRQRLLEIGRESGALCVTSFPASEAGRCVEMLPYCDLLAVNAEEALSLLKALGNSSPQADLSTMACELFGKVSKLNDGMMLMVTSGSKGVVSVQDGNVETVTPFAVAVANTGGAGDAFLGGALTALARGCPLQKGHSDRFFGQTPLASAVELGIICAGMAVESKDSIAFDIDWKSISIRTQVEGWEMGEIIGPGPGLGLPQSQTRQPAVR